MIVVDHVEYYGRQYQLSYDDSGAVSAPWCVSYADGEFLYRIGYAPYSEDAYNLARLDAETFANRITDQ